MKTEEFNIIGIIPARMGSKKFPGKPMADINGMPMIGHVYNRMMRCEDFADVYVATDDQEIIDYIQSIGGNCIKTKESHIGAIDRVVEAVKAIEEIEKNKVRHRGAYPMRRTYGYIKPCGMRYQPYDH